MKKITFLISIFCMLIIPYRLSSQTVFDLTAGTVTDNTPTSVTETVDGITITISTLNNGANNTLFVASSGFGTNGIAAHSSASQNSEEMIISFSQAVDVNTITVNSTQPQNRTWTFTPTGGSNSPVMETGTFASSTQVTLGFTGVTQITITSNFLAANAEQMIFDKLTLASSNTDPTISLANTILNYTEGDAAVLIDAAGTVNDADGDSDWDGGTLVAQITANNEAADEVSISDTDGDGTAITISGTNILSNGIDVGDLSVSGGVVTNGTALTITFDSDATNTIVQEILQSLRYRSTSATPGTSNRTITVTATDNKAGTANDTRIIAVALALNGTWNGSSGNNWNTAANWSTNAVPTAGSDVTIPNGLANYPTVSSSVTVGSINIASGASLIANASVTGTTTYNRNLATNNWYLVSSPVSGESIGDFRTNNNFATGSVAGRIGLAPYDNTLGAGSRWVYQTTSSSGTLNDGQGYSVKLASAGDLTFVGNVNSSNITRNISIGAGNAYNLIGNPFTAYLNSGTGGFLADNSGLLTSQTLWLWNQATNSYETKVTGDDFKLAPGQGFFVECGTAGSVTFETADLSHETTGTFQRSTRTEIHLNISTNKQSSKTKFYFIEEATKGFDNGYDGKMFAGVTNNFAVYSQLVSENKGINYAIQSLSKKDMNGYIIPVGVKTKNSKEIEFSINTENLPEDIFVYLEDRLNDKFINLSENTYKTTLSDNSKDIGQFYVHTTSQKLDVPLSLSIDDVSIYKSDSNTLTIVGLQAKASVKLFSILGKEVMQKEINSNGVSNIDIPSLSTGVYLVEIASEKGKTSRKIILD